MIRGQIVPNLSFRLLPRAMSSSLVLVSSRLGWWDLGCTSADMTPAGYWYLWIHWSPCRFSTPERGILCSGVSVSFRVTVLVSPVSRDLTRRSYAFRLVRPHKVPAVQERYATYGDRVDIRPVDDLIKGDFSNVLKGEHIEWINGAQPQFC